jgi:hypothetical protein
MGKSTGLFSQKAIFDSYAFVFLRFHFVPFKMETPCGLLPLRPQPVVVFPPGIHFKVFFGRTWSDLVGFSRILKFEAWIFSGV